MSITKHTGDFVGELSNIYLIPSNYIETIPETNENYEMDFDDFELKSGKNFEKIYFSPQSGNFSETESMEDPGPLYTKKIGFRIPKNRSEVTLWLRTKRHLFFSAIIQTADDSWWFVERNMKVTHMRKIPETSQQYNGYELTLEGSHNEPSPLLNNVLF